MPLDITVKSLNNDDQHRCARAVAHPGIWRTAMKRPRSLLATLATGALVAAGLIAGSQPAHAANLLTNPGFEAGVAVAAGRAPAAPGRWSAARSTRAASRSPAPPRLRQRPGARQTVDRAAQHRVRGLGLGTRQLRPPRRDRRRRSPGRRPPRRTPNSGVLHQRGRPDLRPDLPARLVRPGHLPRRRHQLRRPRRARRVPGVPGTPTAGTITNTSIALSWSASTGTVAATASTRAPPSGPP